MKIFSYAHYRPCFAALFGERRKLGTGWSTALLAQAIRVQPSHITNVIKERAHFSSDQIFAIGKVLGLQEAEISYLDLLMEWERAEYPERKSQLLNAIHRVRDDNLRAEKKLVSKETRLSGFENETYWLDPNIELLHLYLGTDHAPGDIPSIAQEWGLSIEYISEILRFLEKNGLAVKKRNRWHVEPVRQLLPSSSPLSKPQQMLKRLRATEVLQRLHPKRVYSFSAALTMSEETRLYIQGRFVEFLKEVENAVVESDAEDLYHFQFDLFPWLEQKHKRRS